MRRPFAALVVLGPFAACAAPSHHLVLRAGDEFPFEQVSAEIAAADVVVLGEEHDSARVHAAHLALLRELQAQRPDLVISMEMFERDVQGALTQYVNGDLGEDDFLARARPWPNYRTDYRPVIEFARAHKLEVIAANAPRELATKVSRQGLEAAAGSPYVARTTTAPEDDYWRAFQNTMREESHGAVIDTAAMQRFYAAQCLKDDTMAESIADRITAQRRAGRRPLVVHFCGKFHSDARLGTVARLQQRLPDLRIAVLSVVAVKPQLADFVLVVPETGEEKVKGADPHKLAAAAKADDPHQPANAPAEDAPPQARPALGLRPDYEFEGEGLRVAAVNEGGPAEAAGLREGDVIRKVAGEEVASVEGYMAVLSNLTPGKEVDVVVQRDGKEVKLKVKVGTRAQ